MNSAELARMLNVSEMVLSRWSSSGLLRPEPRRGREGFSWAWEDCLKAATVARLRKEGVPMQRVRKAMAYLEAVDPGRFDRYALVGLGREIVACDLDRGKLPDLEAFTIPGRQGVFVAVVLADVIRDLKEKLPAAGYRVRRGELVASS